MFCDQCGARIDGAIICPSCGATQTTPSVVDSRTPLAAPRLAPDRYRPPYRHGLPPAAAWLSFLGTHLRGTVTAAICTWFNAPFVLLMAAAGALIGGVAGTVSGTATGPGMLDRLNRLVQWGFPLPVTPRELLPTAALQIGGIIGGTLGALTGALRLGWMAAVSPWQILFEGDPLWPFALGLGQIVTALFLGLCTVLVHVVAERPLLYWAGARRLSRREDTWLGTLVVTTAVSMGIAESPTLLMTEDAIPRAYAATRHIVLSRGMVRELEYDRAAIAGVLAHELAHWRRGDPIAAAWIKGVALPLYLLHEIARRLIGGTRNRPLQWVLRAVLWSVLVTVSGIVRPMQAAGNRRAEFACDAAAYRAGHGEGLRRALARLQWWENGRDGWDEVMSASHAYTELRLERLEQPGRRYPVHNDLTLVAPHGRNEVTSHLGEP
jgi:Zn-dependent protease with chaperone function